MNLTKQEFHELMQRAVVATHKYYKNTPVEDIGPSYIEDVESCEFEGFTIEQVDKYGGEDQGSDYWFVVSITDGTDTQYFKYSGHYNSWEGTEWYDFDDFLKEVKPEEKTITVYEAIS